MALHVKTKQRSSKTVWRCSVCERVLATKSSLRVHMYIHTGERPHKCATCNKAFSQKTHLICHMKTHNNQRAPSGPPVNSQSSCRVCGKLFKSFLARNSHMRCHKAETVASMKSTDKLFKCKFCGKMFLTSSGRKRHMNLHMKELGPIRVPHSSKKIAPQNKAYKCYECDLTFRSYSDLNQHRGTHSKVPRAGSHTNQVYQCGECDRTFRSYVYLKLHSDTHELQNKINRVPVEHERPSTDKAEHTTCRESSCLKLESPPASEEPDVKDHNYVCHICSETFAAVMVLKQHLQTHVVKVEADSGPHPKPHLCSVCGQRFLRAYNLKHHLEIHARGGYTCPLCQQVFTFHSWLKRHMKKAHPNHPIQTSPQPEHQCSICGQAFYKEVKMLNHMKYFHKMTAAQPASSTQDEGDLDRVQTQGKSAKSYPCPKCDKTFNNWNSLYKHKRRIHPKHKLTHCCSICNQKFPRQDDLRKHVKGHGLSMRHQCHYCDKSYTLRCNLHRHVKLIHKKGQSHVKGDSESRSESRFKCGLCARCFSDESSRRRHMKKAHTSVRPSLKQSCRPVSHGTPQKKVSESSTTAQLTSSKHLQGKPNVQTKVLYHDQSEDQNTCSVCGKRFANLYCYKLHLRMHTGEKPHSCNICGKRFSYAHQIYHHKRSQHQDSVKNTKVAAKYCSNSSKQGKSTPRTQVSSVNVKISDNPGCSKRKGRQCLLCKKSFPTPSGLSSHMRVHVMFKPHVCFCGKSFTNFHNLKRHKLSHVSVGESDMFVCSVCQMSFKTSNELLSHIQIKHNKLYLSKKSLNNKMKLSKAARLCQCGKCNKRYHFTYQLNSHVKRHTGKTVFACPCGVCFSFRHHLKRHISNHYNPNSRLYIKDFDQANGAFVKQFKKTELARHRCEQCYRVFTDLHSFRCHVLTHSNHRKAMFSTSADGAGSGQKSFKCILCDEKFSTKVKQKYHLKCHTDPRSKLCVTQVEPELLRKQLRILEEKQRHRCAFCKIEFESLTACRQHLQTHSATHSLKELKNGALVSNEKLWCVFCGRRFNILSQLIIHVRTHTGIKPYKCSICQKTFSLPYSLNDHLKNMHNKQHQGDLRRSQETAANNPTQPKTTASASNQYQCDICLREFTLLSSLKIHMTKTHVITSKTVSQSSTSSKLEIATKVPQASSPINNDQKLSSRHYPCTFCSKSFRRMADVLKHYVSCSRSSGPYHCPLCNKPVSTPSKLYAHFRKHSTEKQFKCPICECSYKRRADMRTHMKKLHPSNHPKHWSSARSASRPECSVERIRERAKAFPKKDVAECVVCDKTFKQKLAFNVHMRLHTGELPYTCEVCGKRFMLLSNKVVHVKLLHNYGKDVTKGEVSSSRDGHSPGKMWADPYEPEVPDDSSDEHKVQDDGSDEHKVQDDGSDEHKADEDAWEESNEESDFGEDTMLIDGHTIYVDRASPVEEDEEDDECPASDDELLSNIVDNDSVETGIVFERRAGGGNVNETVSEGTVLQGLEQDQDEVQGQPDVNLGDHRAVVGEYDCIMVDDIEGQGEGLQGQSNGLEGQGYSLNGEMLNQVGIMTGQNELPLVLHSNDGLHQDQRLDQRGVACVWKETTSSLASQDEFSHLLV